MHYLRALVDRDRVDPGDGGTIVFTASTAEEGRDGLVIDQAGWELDSFKSNPVVMFAHDYSRPPIGRAVDVGVSDGRLFVGVKFDRDDAFAAEIERKVRDGYLNAVSVGWDVVERQSNRIIRQDLLEVSVVPIPADPRALVQRQQRALAILGRDLREAVEEFDKGQASDGGASGDRTGARQGTGAMIALLPADAAALAVEGGDSPEQLHVTLAFLAEAGAELPEETLAASAVASAGVAAAAGPFEATVAGYGVLGSDDPPATVLFLQADEIQALHAAVWDRLEGVEGLPEQHPGFLAHLTLGYGDFLEAAAAWHNKTVAFDRIVLAVGEETTVTPLGSEEGGAGDDQELEAVDEEEARAFLASFARTA